MENEERYTKRIEVPPEPGKHRGYAAYETDFPPGKVGEHYAVVRLTQRLGEYEDLGLFPYEIEWILRACKNRSLDLEELKTEGYWATYP